MRDGAAGPKEREKEVWWCALRDGLEEEVGEWG